MKKLKETERMIDEFLSNEDRLLGDEFSQNVLTEINRLEKYSHSQGKKVPLYPALLGMAACFFFFLILSYPQNKKDDKLEKFTTSHEPAVLLGDEEKEIIEDFMTIPEGVSDSEILFSEETYELLVLLDQ